VRDKTHPLDQEEVMAYLDGELSVEEATRASEHLGDCRECQELAANLQGVSRHIAAWQVGEAQPGMTPAIVSALQEIEASAGRSVGRGSSSWQHWFTLAAMPRWAWAVSVPVLLFLVMAGFLTTGRYASRRQAMTAISAASQTAPAPPSRPQLTVEMDEDPGRDRLKAPQAQVSSNMEYAASTPHIAGPRPAEDNATKGLSFASSRTMIARTAQLSVIVKDFDTSQRRLEDILKRRGGYVGEMATSAPEGADRKLTATLRVPSNQLDAAIAEVKELGRVESESQGGEEVTSQYVDLQARLTNARNTEQRLTELLRRQTGKLDEVVTVEEKISDVREQIERMEAEQKNLSERVEFGTLSVSLSEERKTQLQVMPPSVGTQFHNAAVEGYRSVVDGIVSFIVFLMSWGPTLLLWSAITFFPARASWRKLRRADA